MFETETVTATIEHTHSILRYLVDNCRCKPGWFFRIVGDEPALFLVIRVDGTDSFDPERERSTQHFHPVPIATYNKESWQRWIYERCRGVENHELGEWLRFVVEAEPIPERPFLPAHGPGEDPYVVTTYRPRSVALIMQDGRKREEM
jgi:hypothetical protein